MKVLTRTRRRVQDFITSGEFSFAVVFAVIVLLATSCVRTKVQEQVQIPTLQAAWPEVRFDIEAAPESIRPTVEELDEVGDILARAVIVEIRTIEWAPLEAAALAGIEELILAGEYSEGVAVSRREQLSRFRDSLLDLQRLRF